MSKLKHCFSLPLLVVCYLLAFTITNSQASDLSKVRNTHIFMAGDSTMAEKHPKDFPETGWGVPFSHFFNDSISVVNVAKNGRSTRAFIEEGRWQLILSSLVEGDYVFIQFGHNDESENKVDRYTTPEQYQDNLTRMIREAREKGAEPILMSPIIRRHYDKKNRLLGTHPYSKFVRLVAEEQKVTFIDAERITHNYFQSLGDAGSALRFMHIQAGLHPNYPFGVRDNTHLNPLGAVEVAQLVLRSLRNKKHPLSLRLREVDPKHLKLKY